MAEIVCLNGRLIPSVEAALSPFDHGFLYGYGLFETMRAYGGHIFRLDRHLARLRRSARSIGLGDGVMGALETPGGEESLEAACLKTLQANGLSEARIRLTVSAGEGDMTPDATPSRATVLVTVRPPVPPSPEKYRAGYKAVTSSVSRNSGSPLSRLKSTCYLENLLARAEARAAGCDEAIMLNEQGHLAEGSTTNIFLVGESPSAGGRGRGGVLITPSIESGVLPGITREAVLEIAGAMNIETRERAVELRELREAGEAFLTNSIVEIMPLTRFEGRPIGNGKPGAVTGTLLAAFRRLVREEAR